MDWSYVAGFFDGEGHAGIHAPRLARGRRGKARTVVVSMANTHLQTLERIQAFLTSQGIASTIYIETRQPPRKPIGQLKILGHVHVRTFLYALLPLTITRLDPIVNVLSFIEGREWQMPHTADALAVALDAYKRGASTRDIERAHGISSRAFRAYAKSIGFALRSKREAARLSNRR